MIVQLNVTFFLCIDSHFLRHEDLVVWSEEARDLILIDQIVDVFKHETVLQLVVSEEECALFQVTASLIEQLFHVLCPLVAQRRGCHHAVLILGVYNTCEAHPTAATTCPIGLCFI